MISSGAVVSSGWLDVWWISAVAMRCQQFVFRPQPSSCKSKNSIFCIFSSWQPQYRRQALLISYCKQNKQIERHFLQYLPPNPSSGNQITNRSFKHLCKRLMDHMFADFYLNWKTAGFVRNINFSSFGGSVRRQRWEICIWIANRNGWSLIPRVIWSFARSQSLFVSFQREVRLLVERGGIRRTETTPIGTYRLVSSYPTIDCRPENCKWLSVKFRTWSEDSQNFTSCIDRVICW